MSSAAINQSDSLTRTIALMNQKGGVGKTTTAVNLAAGLAALGRSTLLIDLDPQAHASLHLGVAQAEAPEPRRPTVYDVLTAEVSGHALGATFDAALVKARDHLWVLPAETDLAGVETELAPIPPAQRTSTLRRAVEQSTQRFEFVLIDCPPSLGTLTLNGLCLAREVFIPMQAQFLALQGVGKLLETVKLISQEANPLLRVTGVVLCAHDTATTHSREVVADLDSFFESARATNEPWRSARVYRPAIRRNIKLAEAPSFGKSIFEYEPTCPGASDYRKLADILAREWDEVKARLAAKAG